MKANSLTTGMMTTGTTTTGTTMTTAECRWRKLGGLGGCLISEKTMMSMTPKGVASVRRRGRNAKVMMIGKRIKATAATLRGKARGMGGKLDLKLLPPLPLLPRGGG